MLAGLQSAVDTLFPSIRDIAPDDDQLRQGEDKLRCGRVVRLSAYNTRIFDMHSAKDRSAYDKCMMDLSVRAQVGTVRILAHDRQVMSRKDGSSGWFMYLEWMEYTRDPEPGKQAANAGDKPGKAHIDTCDGA